MEWTHIMPRQAKAKKQKELTLEDALWNCRVALRGVGSIEKNRDAVISLVFLKFAGDKFEARRRELPNVLKEQYGLDDCPPEMLENPSFYNAANVYYLPEEARWSYLVKNAGANDIAVRIDNAMAEAERINPALKGALPLGLFATLGAEIRSIKALIDAINQISETRFHEEDLIGRVYEYFLQIFAAGSSKEDGEFYTPACIVQLIAELIEPYEGVVYDPCCGSGGMFVQSHKFVERHHGNSSKISVVGQESNPDTWRLCKMNLAIRGISCNLGDTNASTFINDKHKDLKADYIMANPPFNLKGWRDEDELTKDPRWRGYALPPTSNANYAWILHILSKLDVTHGVAGFLLANGALNADGVEQGIRQKLIENDKVEAIIVLPRDMFYTTDISVTLWILNMDKAGGTKGGHKLRDRRHEILFCDLRTWDQNVETYTYDKGKRKKKTVLTPEQIAKVKDIYDSWLTGEGYEDVPELCKSVSVDGPDGIASHNYTLTPSDYIGFINHDYDIDFQNEFGNINNNLEQLLNNQQLVHDELASSLSRIQDRATTSTVSSYRIGDLVDVVDERNNLGIRDFYGINIDKQFMPTVANTDGLDETKYKIVRKNRFVYSGMQTGRDRAIRISMYTGDNPIIVSPAYTTFEIKRTDILDPAYFFMLFMSPEMDRLGWFKSDGSIRSNLDWPVFCSFQLTLPSLQIQKLYSGVYAALLDNQEIEQAFKRQLRGICPILIRGSIEEATR